ncbi:MAG: hypothetical protein IJ756_01090 [Paludibacteraceae bacterium]|nr:hypothetical protein [Paludibacteraceae bacterium]
MSKVTEDATITLNNADSLYLSEQIFTDTTALKTAIASYEKANRKKQYNDDLARLYYYLGRNHTLNNNDIEAVKCYIAADRLQPADYELRGRINANMGNICSEENVPAMALIFDARCVECFKKGKNVFLFTEGLFSLADDYADIGDCEMAEALFDTAVTYCDTTQFNSLFYWKARVYYFYCNNLDSALYYLQLIKEDDSDYFNNLAKSIYYDAGDFDRALYYARRVVEESENASMKVGAYYILHEDAEKRGDVNAMTEYFHLRQDCDSISTEIRLKRAEAIQIINEYLESGNIHNISYFWLYFCAVLFVFLFILLLYVFHHHSRKVLKNDLNIAKNIIENKALEIDSLKNSHIATKNDILQDFGMRLAGLDGKALKKTLQWDDDELFLKEVNFYFLGLSDKLRIINPKITAQDVRLYVLVLLDYKLTNIANMLNRSVKGRKNLKTASAEKLNVSSKDLKKTLIDIITSPVNDV